VTGVPNLDLLRPALDRALATGRGVPVAGFIVVPVEVVDAAVFDLGLDPPPATRVAERQSDGARCYVYRDPRVWPGWRRGLVS